MRLAIISDIHYPAQITRQTILTSLCGYTDHFYSKLENDTSKLTPDDVRAFIINGDFYWDIRYFARTPIIPPDWGMYVDHVRQLRNFRKLLHPDIRLIMIEGNHDYWFQSYIFSENGTLYIDEDCYFDHLIKEWSLNENQALRVLSLLDFYDGKLELGKNVYLLRNEGLLIDNYYIYGLPYYEREREALTWANY